MVGIEGTTGSVTGTTHRAEVTEGNQLAVIGSVYNMEDVPTSTIFNNPAWEFGYITSGTATGVTGSSIGSIIQFIGAGSYVQTITWSNNLIVNLGSFS